LVLAQFKLDITKLLQSPLITLAVTNCEDCYVLVMLFEKLIIFNFGVFKGRK